MKADEAPEKLYLHPTAKGKVGASWLTFPLTNEDIEYVRKDAFIKKACDAYCEICDTKECEGCVECCNGIATVKGLAVAMTYNKGVADTKEQMMKNIWKDAQGDDLPEYEREVVVFTQNFPDDAGMMMVAIGHRPTPEGYDGKSLATGEIKHYTPKTYDKGGWNIPDVKYWLDVELPKEMEE